VAEVLLAHGADVNAKSKNGNTPMHLAELNRHKNIVSLLGKHGGQD
jgi:ankyrin repeat protein